MNRACLWIPIVGLLITPVARGGDIPFTFMEDNGGAGFIIGDNTVSVFSLEMGSNIQEITSIELKITGLSHTFPDDLQIILIDPFATGREGIEIMIHRGDGFNIVGVDLVFSDDAHAPPPDEALITSGSYRPHGDFFETDDGMSTFVGNPGGFPSDWILVMIDGSVDDSGSFESWTLSGTYVPEPVTLSLLALGAIVALRRKRR